MEEGVQRIAARPHLAGKRDGREIRGLRDADLCVRGDEGFFGLADVRASLDQGGGKPCWHYWHARLLVDGQTASDGAGILTQQSLQRILFLRNLSLEIGNLRCCG